MPLNSSSDSQALLYPNLNELDLNTTLAPPCYDQALAQSASLKDKTFIISQINSGKTAYIAADTEKAVDVSGKDNDFLNKDKRKLICVLESKKDKKISIKEYDNDEFVSNFLVNADDDIVSKHDKKKPKKVRAIIYVKTSELYDDLKKLKENTLISIDKNINKFIQDRKVEKYENYPDMRCAYDVETGESIESISKNINLIFDKLNNIIEELNGKKIETSILEEQLGKMRDEKIRFESTIKRSEPYTYAPLLESILSSKVAFDNKVEALVIEANNMRLKEKHQAMHNELVNFKEKCEEPIILKCTEANVIEKIEIIKQVILLLEKSESLKNCAPSELEIDGLQNKLNELKKNFDILNSEILKTSDNIHQDTRKDISKKIEPLFQKLKALVAQIEFHKTDENKEKIQESLIQKINILLQLEKNSSEDFVDAINEANKFIEENSEGAHKYTGGFFGKALGKESVLGKLMDELKILLDKFLKILSPNHTNREVSNNLATISPRV